MADAVAGDRLGAQLAVDDLRRSSAFQGTNGLAQLQPTKQNVNISWASGQALVSTAGFAR